MNADEIKDSDRLKRWLDGQPATSDAEKAKARCWTSAIAHRAAMRVLPLALSTLHEKTSSRPDLTEIPIWRASIISGVAAVKPSREIRDAATHAGSSAYSTSIDGDYIDAGDAYYAPAYAAAASADDDLGIAGDPAVAAGAAAHSAAAKAANAVPDFWRFIQLDCAALEAGTRLENSPLWSTHNPLAEHWAAVREHILAQDEGWSFWVDWYDKALTGQPQDWTGLLTEVALIPTEDWEKGAEHLNAFIAEIVARRKAAEAKPDARTVAVIRRNVAANRTALPFQIDGLLAILEFERERIRGDNALEPEERERLLAVFDRMGDAARGISAAVPDARDPDKAAAEEIGTWGLVLTRAAQHWNFEAKKVVLGRDADPKVVLVGRIVLGGAVAGVLTAVGLPGYATIAGGAIALKGGISEIGKAVGARLPGAG